MPALFISRGKLVHFQVKTLWQLVWHHNFCYLHGNRSPAGMTRWSLFMQIKATVRSWCGASPQCWKLSCQHTVAISFIFLASNEWNVDVDRLMSILQEEISQYVGVYVQYAVNSYCHWERVGPAHSVWNRLLVLRTAMWPSINDQRGG